jgi:glycosyltransferase involved in cell wall biosynthesis
LGLHPSFGCRPLNECFSKIYRIFSASMYKICIDCTAYQYGRAPGFNAYTHNLLIGLNLLLRDEACVSIDVYVRKDQLHWFANKYESIQFKGIDIRSLISRVLWQNLFLPFLSLRYQKILFIGNFAPVISFIKYLLVVHDLNFLKYPQNFSKIALYYRKFIQKISIRNAYSCIAISKHTAKEILEYAGVQSTVIYNPVSEVFPSQYTNKKDKEEEHNILCVSSLAVHKNIDATCEAANRFAKENPNIKIIFIGAWNPENFPCQNFAPGIIPLGFVSDEKKALLFKNADAILIPSVYEGFGLPFIEARMHNKFLICSEIDVAREVVGDFPVYIKAPFDSEEIYLALKRAKAAEFIVKDDKFENLYTPELIAKKYFDILTND